MRRISLSVLAGVALIGVTAVLLRSAGSSPGQPAGLRTAHLVAAPTSRLTGRAPSRLAHGRSGVMQSLAEFRATHPLFPTVRQLKSGQRPRTIHAPLIQSAEGMSCPVATGSRPGGCSIVPCAKYIGAAQTSYTASGSGLGLAVLPRVTPRPSSGVSAPACVSRPGRPPELHWVSAAGR